MGRLREGRAKPPAAPPHFLRETVGLRYAGARGQLTVRADRFVRS